MNNDLSCPPLLILGKGTASQDSPFPYRVFLLGSISASLLRADRKGIKKGDGAN